MNMLESDFLTVEQVAELLQCSSHSIRDLINTNQIPFIRLNRKIIRVSKIQLLEFLYNQHSKPNV